MDNSETGLCLKLLYYCALSSEKTNKMNGSEVVEILQQLFPDEVIQVALSKLAFRSSEDLKPTTCEGWEGIPITPIII